MNRVLTAIAALMISAAPAMSERVSVLVFDASGSMWNRVEGDLTRIEVARDVMADYFGSRDAAVPLSVIAYGHNRRGDCGDIEVIAPMGQTAAGTLESRLRALMPRGMTPLTDSLALARDQIPPTAEAADIILVTDGLETCEGDPCALAANLAAEGIDIRAHVVGFGLSAAEVAALSCITDQTGGMLFQTNSGAELAEALQQVSAAPPPPPVAEPGTPALFAQNFVFRDIGTGTPHGLMEWRAEAPDGTVIDLGTTDGIQQSLQGVSVEMPLGDWLIVAEGAEGRAERQMTLTQCCGRHGIPFTGNDMAAVIPPMGQVQAGMGARLPYEITHPGVGNLGGTPYQVIATGPEGALTPDQILRQDPLTRRDSGIQGARTGELAPGTYRFLIVVARNGDFDIKAERSFDAVEAPVIGIVGPDRATPGERIEVGFDGGYTTRDWIEVVDENDRRIGQGNALYRGPGGGSGGPVTMPLVMPNREGTFDMVVRREGEILARRPITISATPAPAQGQDALPTVTATFRQPPGLPFDMSHWRAEPLDPDLPPEGLRIDGNGPVVTATLQPGRWRIIAEGMADTILYTEIDIFPGQPNDFTLDMDAMQVDGALTGDWTLWALPPEGITDPPRNMASISLRPTLEGMDYIGSFTTTAAMGGVLSGDLQQVSWRHQEAALEILFLLPPVGPEPLRLSLTRAPEGGDFEGMLIVPTGAFPVALRPDETPPRPEREGNAARQSHIPDHAKIVARCDAPEGCATTVGAVGLTLPDGWAMTEPLFFSAVGHALPSDWPKAAFYGPETDALLQLNPHQWLESNGPCFSTVLGPLCWFDHAPPSVVEAAWVIGPSLAVSSQTALGGTLSATFRLPADMPQSDVTWSAVPLGPEMGTHAWAPAQTGPVITGNFAPGNWRIIATAPGEVSLSADVAISEGQANDFTVQLDASGDEDHGAIDLQGTWRILTVPPYDAPAGSPTDPLKIMDVVLEINGAGDGYQGRFTPTPAAFGTVLFEREIDSVVEEDGALILTMALPVVDPAPFVLSVMPFAEGYAGTLVASANSLPVVFWPDAVPLPPSARLQAALHGPNPADQGMMQTAAETVFACAQSVCAWTDPASGLTLPLPMGWSVTAPEFETASATPTATDLPSLSLFGPEGQELRLNPRQWVDSNGTCLDTRDLGRLCHFADADIAAQMVAGMIAPMIYLGQPVTGAQTRPVRISLANVARDTFYSIEIALVAGDDAAFAIGQQFAGHEALQDHQLGVGNVYDIRAVLGTREYRNRAVTITPGSAVQEVMLAPVFGFEDVTLTLPAAPIVAASGAFFPVTLTAPADFNGSIAVHDADDRNAPAIFTISAAQMMNAQDQVLPVPERPGFYEIQFLDMTGEMFGGTEFEVVAADAAQGGTAPEGPVSLALGSDWDLVAGSGGYFPVDIVAPADLTGQLDIEGQNGTVVYSTALATLIAAQDPSLPIPDAPGMYQINITDQTGTLRATTGFEVRADADQAGITVTLTATTQFGVGCMIGATLSMPPGPRFTFTVPVTGADATGATIAPIVQKDGDQVLEITGFDTTGASLIDANFLSPCDALILTFGAAQCRMGESDAPGACPYPVTYVAPSALLGVHQTGGDRIETAAGQPSSPDQEERPASATGGATPDFIDIDLGERDADTIIDILFPPTGSE